MSSIKLMLIDNYKIVRTGVRMLLQSQPDIEVVTEADSWIEAIALIQTYHLDVVLMDVTALGMNEMKAIHQLKACCPSVAILVLVIDGIIHKEKDRYSFQMFNAGASGCIPSQATSEDLLRAIRTVYQSEVCLSPHSSQGPG
jgi:DNA-binding NarL/FixJ family response regulator